MTQGKTCTHINELLSNYNIGDPITDSGF